MLPVVAMLMPESPSDIGLAPYGASTALQPSPQRDNPFAVAMAALSRAARSIDFWLLTLSFGICGFSISTAPWPARGSIQTTALRQHSASG
jgi:hypothetical protein